VVYGEKVQPGDIIFVQKDGGSRVNGATTYAYGTGTGQPQATGSVQLTGSDNGFCQFFGVKNGCDANYVLQSTLYDDGSVVGKVTDVSKVPGNEAILVQADVDCMKFFFIGGNKYAVVGGVITKGDKLVDILELDSPLVGRRFFTVVKEDADGVVSFPLILLLLTLVMILMQQMSRRS